MCLPKWPVMFAGYISCFAGVLIHFCSGKFQALDMSYFSKGLPDFSVNFGMTRAKICRKYQVPRICVFSILVVVFDRFSINVLTMNIGNV